jgi:hypothetical protein
MTARLSASTLCVGVLVVLVWCAPVCAVVAASAGQDARAGQVDAAGIVVPPPGETQELVLRDGTRAYGRVERVEGDRVVFRTTVGGVLEVDAAGIASLRTVQGRVINGEFLPADSNPTRLFFGPTGRSLPRGSGYVAVYEVVAPFVQVGITDRISLGAGTPLVFADDTAHPFWITPKVQVLARPTTQAAVGVMHFTNVSDGYFGVAYGVVTKGSRDSAVTFGVGYAYAYDRGDGEHDSTAIAMIGGEHRVSRRVKLITENYVFSGGGIGTFGVRFLGDHLSADLGLAVPIGADDFIAFPVVNFVWRFGRE